MSEHSKKIQPHELEELDEFAASYDGPLSAVTMFRIRDVVLHETCVELTPECRPVDSMRLLVKLAEANHKDRIADTAQREHFARAAGLAPKYWFLVSGRIPSDGESIVQAYHCHDAAEAIAAHKLLVLEDIVEDVAEAAGESCKVLIDWVYTSRTYITQITNEQTT